MLYKSSCNPRIWKEHHYQGRKNNSIVWEHVSRKDFNNSVYLSVNKCPLKFHQLKSYRPGYIIQHLNRMHEITSDSAVAEWSDRRLVPWMGISMSIIDLNFNCSQYSPGISRCPILQPRNPANGSNGNRAATRFRHLYRQCCKYFQSNLSGVEFECGTEYCVRCEPPLLNACCHSPDCEDCHSKSNE